MKELSRCGGLNGGCGTKVYPISTDHILNENFIQFTKTHPEHTIQRHIDTIETLNRVVELHDINVNKYQKLEFQFYALLLINVMLIIYITSKIIIW